MRNIKITIEYDGKDFNGWQKQPKYLNIQGEIEKAIETITKENSVITETEIGTEMKSESENQIAPTATSSDNIKQQGSNIVLIVSFVVIILVIIGAGIFVFYRIKVAHRKKFGG